jgi:hypothetical protein
MAKKPAAKKQPVKEFEVSVTVRLEVAGTFTLKAKNQEDAQKQAEQLVSELEIVKWEVSPIESAVIDWEETEQTAEVESVEEVG